MRVDPWLSAHRSWVIAAAAVLPPLACVALAPFTDMFDNANAALLLVLSLLWPHAGPALPLPGARDLWLLAVLAVGCTLLPFALSLVALRELSAFAAQLAINLEPVYAIVLAILLLGEQRELGATFYVGVAVILAAVLAHPLLVPAPRAAAERSANGTPAP